MPVIMLLVQLCATDVPDLCKHERVHTFTRSVNHCQMLSQVIIASRAIPGWDVKDWRCVLEIEL